MSRLVKIAIPENTNLVNTWEAFSSIRCCFSLKEALNSKWPLPPFYHVIFSRQVFFFNCHIRPINYHISSKNCCLLSEFLSHGEMRIRVRYFQFHWRHGCAENCDELHNWEHLRHRKPARFNRVPFYFANNELTISATWAAFWSIN